MRQKSYVIDSLIDGLQGKKSRRVETLIEPIAIITIIQNRYRIEISKRTRKKEYVEPRMLASFFLHKYTLLSLKRIGFYVGVSDHTSVLHHVHSVQDSMDVYKHYADNVASIDEEIQNYYKTIYDASNGI